jgi:putative nucleotidyltransferase with HDIG domain
VGLLLAILPLFFIRHSYQTTHQLQLANNDLLEALVKAIETRDPYTSGYSRRVSHLARRIAEELGQSSRVVWDIETAGFLHDIGKIEAVYSDILRKPDGLTPGERAVIESHVTKGVELLRKLASVREQVIRAVRHHHEREDGQGYPDGLLSDEIPLGAKIIVVCDAVDAMLSDRPYRKALPMEAVYEQLREHAGRQFDHRVVRALVHSSILTEYAELMNTTRAEARVEEVGPLSASRRDHDVLGGSVGRRSSGWSKRTGVSQ